MLLTSKFKSLKGNILFVVNLVIVSSLINYILVGQKLFDKAWLYSSFGILISYIFYIFLIEDLIKFDDKDYNIKKMKSDAFRLFVVFTLSHLLNNIFTDGSLNISLLWILQTCITIFFYVYLDYISCDFVLKLNNYENLFVDIIKIFTAEILATLITFQHLNLIDLSDLIAYIISYITWTLIIKKLILHNIL
jgi:hypothetical protein